MKKVDLIIQVLQEELINKKKSYFSLAQATKILKGNGILTPEEISNGFLKNALEKGLIPQATKTSKKPRQWRIHKDKNYIPNKQVKNSLKIETKESEKARGQKKAKALINTERVDKNNKNQLIFTCPICGVDLTVPGKYIRHDELKCYNCQRTFKNPIFYPHDETVYEKIELLPKNNDSTLKKIKSAPENNYWTEYNKKYPNFKYVLIISIIFLSVFLITKYVNNSRIDNQQSIEEKIVKKDKKEVRNPLIIYYDMKEAFKKHSFNKCRELFYEMQKDHSESIFFEKVKDIYDSALYFQFNKQAKVKKNNNKISKRPKNASKSLKAKKILNVEAQAYPDGIISCNVYLNDLSGHSYYLDAKSLSVKIYGVNGFMNPTGELTTKNTNSGLYIDIPMGSSIIYAERISFIILTRDGTTYKSGFVQIEH